jgi:hypothetical protein
MNRHGLTWEWWAFTIFWYFQIFYAAEWAMFFMSHSVYVIVRYAYYLLTQCI